MNGATRVLRCTALLAGHTLREAWRQRAPAWLAALAAAFAGGAWLLRDVNFGASELKFLLDAGFAAQAFFGAVLAIVATAQPFFAALDRGSIQMVLARPVRRGEFIAGHLGGVLLLLLGFCAVVTTVLATLLWWREAALLRADPGAFAAGRHVPYAGLAWAGLAQWLRLGVLAAITMLVASYARSALFTILTAFGAWVAGQLQHLAPARPGAWLLGVIVPDLHRFDLTDQISAGGAVPAAQIAGLAAGAAVYVAAFGVLAACCFQHRDL